MNYHMMLIAGPCVMEGRGQCIEIAQELHRIARQLDLQFIFKASYDKANRTSVDSYRGVGLIEGLSILDDVRMICDVTTDVHSSTEAVVASNHVDVLQIPAMLNRQTDLVQSAAQCLNSSRQALNVKKSQMMKAIDAFHVVKKVKLVNPDLRVFVTERGNMFGYNDLVVDFRNLVELSRFADRVIFDASHSIQLPGGHGTSSSGQREMIEPLAAAAIATGAIDGVFIEVHPDPRSAKCDGDIAYPLKDLSGLLGRLKLLYNTMYNAVRLNANSDHHSFSSGQSAVPQQGFAQDSRKGNGAESLGPS